MNDKNEKKLEVAKKALTEKGIVYTEFANGQLQVDKVNYWATSEKWHDAKRNVKGEGINSFISHLTNCVIV